MVNNVANVHMSAIYMYQATWLYMDLLFVMCDSCILNLIMNLCKWQGEHKKEQNQNEKTSKRAMQQSIKTVG